MKNIFFADFFAGIGGFHHAFFNVIRDKKLDYKYNIQCALVSEIDKFAKEVYSKQFDYDFNKIKDINDINATIDMKNINIVFCGFPCQSFSSAGNKLGFDDEKRGQLIFKVIDIIKQSKPKIILLENVKHLVNHNNNKTFTIIVDNFKSLGYVTTESPLILSPKMLNIKQDRKRVFIPLVHNSLCKKKFLHESKDLEFEKTISSDIDNILETHVPKKYYMNVEFQEILKAWKEFVEHFIKNNRNIPVIWLDEMLIKNFKIKPHLKNCEWHKKYLSSMKNFYNENEAFIDSWAVKYKPLDWKLRRDRKLEWQAGKTKFNESYLQLRQSGLRFRKNDCFPTLVASVQTPLICQKNLWRRLTPIEVSRLQSFPKDHFICENEHQAYKQYGNSINIKVAEWVIRNYLFEYLEKLND